MKRKPSQVDLSQMQTDIGRTMASRLNSASEISATQMHRTVQVLNEYMFYERAYQLDLATATIFWAIASLAHNERRNDCKDYLYTFVDLMYPSTDDAGKACSDSERRRICVAAEAVIQDSVESVNDIVCSSVEVLRGFDKDNLRRMIAESLHLTLSKYIEHAAPQYLSDLIGHCVIMCMSLEAVQKGVGSSEDVVNSLGNVSDSKNILIESVHAQIDSGNLVVRNGQIINPNGD
jgi:hypothetical protein